MNRPFPARWLSRPLFGWTDVGPGDVAWALLLSGIGAFMVSGLTGTTDPNNGVTASLAILVMTAPVGFARRQPLLAAATLAGGAALSWLVVGDLVRCGVALPAAFYVSYVVGSRCARGVAMVAGVALVSVNVVCQAYSDPQLGVGVVFYMVPIAFGFAIAGRLLQGGNASVARLHALTGELREQRERNARLAVAADQARIAGDLDGFLRTRVEQIAAATATGQASVHTEPEQAKDAFVTIQNTGREALTHMRTVVSGLRDPASTEPQPVLAQLERLLAQATVADARLRISGDPRLLPPGVELSGYRIVEHLLVAQESDPSARVDVHLTFATDRLELAVSGPSSRHADARAALAAATARAALHGGTLRTQATGGRLETVVLLPLASGHV